MAFPKVPTKITILGDRNVGSRYIGEAKSQLFILENQMKFGNLKQGVRTVRVAEDVVVEIYRSFDLSNITIHAPLKQEIEGVVVEEEQDCYCSCDFVYGIIEGFSEGSPTEDDSLLRKFDVISCRGKQYTKFENISPSDFAHYEEGDDVIILNTVEDVDCLDDPKDNRSCYEDGPWVITIMKFTDILLWYKNIGK